jgi:hypothetical protein
VYDQAVGLDLLRCDGAFGRGHRGAGKAFRGGSLHKDLVEETLKIPVIHAFPYASGPKLEPKTGQVALARARSIA